MKRIAMVCAAAAIAVACGRGEAKEELGVVDGPTLEAGIPVTLQGSTGALEVLFLKPVPAASEERVAQVLKSSVLMIVKSPRTGLTANFATAVFLPPGSTPTAADEYTWGLNEARDRATLTFFNLTGSGLTLKSGEDYTVELEVLANELVEAVPAMTFVVHAQPPLPVTQ